MSGILTHSPADILRWRFIDLGYGTDPTTNDVWPIYVDMQPSDPDNCITLFDTLGRNSGLSNPEMERQEHHGFSTMIRSISHPTGYTKARQLAVAMDNTIGGGMITIDGVSYCIYTVSRITDVARIGIDNPDTKRHLYTINCVAHIRQHS